MAAAAATTNAAAAATAAAAAAAALEVPEVPVNATAGAGSDSGSALGGLDGGFRLFGASASTVGLVVAGVLGTAALAYTVYFDYKRRHSAEFRRYLRQLDRDDRRAQAELAKKQRANADPRILLQQEVQNAELLARAGTPHCAKHARGAFRESAEALLRALTLHPNPSLLLNGIQQHFPPQVNMILIEMLQAEMAQELGEGARGQSGGDLD